MSSLRFGKILHFPHCALSATLWLTTPLHFPFPTFSVEAHFRYPSWPLLAEVPCNHTICLLASDFTAGCSSTREMCVFWRCGRCSDGMSNEIREDTTGTRWMTLGLSAAAASSMAGVGRNQALVSPEVCNGPASHRRKGLSERLMLILSWWVPRSGKNGGPTPHPVP